MEAYGAAKATLCLPCSKVANLVIRRWVAGPMRYDTPLRDMAAALGLTYAAMQQRASRIARGRLTGLKSRDHLWKPGQSGNPKCRRVTP